MPEEHTVPQILAAEGIADYAQDLRQLSAAELRALFAFASAAVSRWPRRLQRSEEAGVGRLKR